MATQNPLLSPGQWVQYNVTTQAPLAPLPSPEEQTIGIIRQGFTGLNGPYYLVVWLPGSKRPKSGLYSADALTSLSQDDANQILSQLSQGTYQSNLGTPSSDYTPGQT